MCVLPVFRPGDCQSSFDHKSRRLVRALSGSWSRRLCFGRVTDRRRQGSAKCVAVCGTITTACHAKYQLVALPSLAALPAADLPQLTCCAQVCLSASTVLGPTGRLGSANSRATCCQKCVRVQSVVSPPFLILLKILASHPKCLQEQEERQQRCQAWKLPEDQELMFPFTEA